MKLQEALKTTGDIKLRRQLWDYSMLALKIRQNNFFNIETNQIYTLTYLDIIADDWIVSKLKCAHEPDFKMRGLLETLNLPANAPLEFECRKCLKPLKAEKWVEA